MTINLISKFDMSFKLRFNGIETKLEKVKNIIYLFSMTK